MASRAPNTGTRGSWMGGMREEGKVPADFGFRCRCVHSADGAGLAEGPTQALPGGLAQRLLQGSAGGQEGKDPP